MSRPPVVVYVVLSSTGELLGVFRYESAAIRLAINNAAQNPIRVRVEAGR